MQALAAILVCLLASPSFAARTAAHRAITLLGPAALPALTAAADCNDLHARQLTHDLLAEIQGREVRLLLEEAESLPWLDSLPGIPQPVVSEYLDRARQLLPQIVCVWSGAARMMGEEWDWADYKSATALYRRERGLTTAELDVMRARVAVWREKRGYPP